MSLEDYNRHARWGPLAGVPQNASEREGQAAYYDQLKKAGGFDADGGTYVPHAQTKPPRWMMQHAFKRGLAFFFGAQAVTLLVALFTGPARSGLAEFVSVVCALVSLAGVVLMICGVLNFITRKRRGGNADAASSPKS